MYDWVASGSNSIRSWHEAPPRYSTYERAHSSMDRVPASEAGDPGSNPGGRIFSMRFVPRFHLSTLIACVLAASAFVGLNVRNKIKDLEREREYSQLNSEWELRHPGEKTCSMPEERAIAYGWPAELGYSISAGRYESTFTLWWRGLVIDLIALFFGVALFGCLCELVAKRKRA